MFVFRYNRAEGHVPDAPVFHGIPDIGTLLGGTDGESLLDLRPSQWHTNSQHSGIMIMEIQMCKTMICTYCINFKF